MIVKYTTIKVEGTFLFSALIEDDGTHIMPSIVFGDDSIVDDNNYWDNEIFIQALYESFMDNHFESEQMIELKETFRHNKIDWDIKNISQFQAILFEAKRMKMF